MSFGGDGDVSFNVTGSFSDPGAEKLQRSLDEVRSKAQALHESFRRGDVDAGVYVARLASLEKQEASLERQIDKAAEAAERQAKKQQESSERAAAAAERQAQRVQEAAERQAAKQEAASERAAQAAEKAAQRAAAAAERQAQREADQVDRQLAAIGRLAQGTVVVTPGVEGVTRATRDWGRAILATGQGLEDLQYSVGGFLNNVPMIVQSLGGSAGLVGAITVTAAGAYTLYRNWDTLTALMGQGIPVPAKAGIEGLEERIKSLTKETDELAKKTRLSLQEYDKYVDATEQIKRLNDELTKQKELQELGRLQTEEQRQYSQAFRAALPEAGGLEDVQAKLAEAIQRMREARGMEAAAPAEIDRAVQELILGASAGGRQSYEQIQRVLAEGFGGRETRAQAAFRFANPEVAAERKATDEEYERQQREIDRIAREGEQRRRRDQQQARRDSDEESRIGEAELDRQIREMRSGRQRREQQSRRDEAEQQRTIDRTARELRPGFAGLEPLAEEAIRNNVRPDQFGRMFAGAIARQLQATGQQLPPDVMKPVIDRIIQDLYRSARNAINQQAGGNATAGMAMGGMLNLNGMTLDNQGMIAREFQAMQEQLMRQQAFAAGLGNFFGNRQSRRRR
jgi:hypothetical protein